MTVYAKGDSKLLDHPVRAAILEYAEAEPGISYSGLLEMLRSRFGKAVGNGNLQFHLSKLERAKLLTSRRSGRWRLYYPATGPWHADLDACAAIQSSLHRGLARALVGSEGATLQELRLKVDEGNRKKPALRRHLRRFRAAGLIEIFSRGHATAYRATPRLHRAIALASPETSIPLPAEAVAGTPLQTEISA